MGRRSSHQGRTFRFESPLAIAANEFIADKDTDTYRGFHMERVGTRELEILSDDLDVATNMRTQIMRTVPGIKLPRIVRGLVPNGKVEFVDTRRYEEGSQKRTPFVQEFTTVNNITKHSIVRGTITVEATGRDTCVVVGQGVCSVTLRGVGGLIENIVVDGIKKSYEELPRIVDEWKVYKQANGIVTEVHTEPELTKSKSWLERVMSRTASSASLAQSFHSAKDLLPPAADALEDENDAEKLVPPAKVNIRRKKRVSIFACCTSASATEEEEVVDTDMFRTAREETSRQLAT